MAELNDPGILPAGLTGAYDLAFAVLSAALQKDRPDLLPILRQRVLPVLVAVREAPTLEQLAWLASADEGIVTELMGYAANLFPLRSTGPEGHMRVSPYHKSVLDWLTSSPASQASAASVSPTTGHALAAAACHSIAASLSYSGAVQSANDKQAYALRHTIVHLALAGDVSRLVEAVLHVCDLYCNRGRGQGLLHLATGWCRRDLMGTACVGSMPCSFKGWVFACRDRGLGAGAQE